MRSFLKDINIVGCTMAHREGDLLRFCIDDLLKYCNSVVIQLDNNDEKTLKVAEEYMFTHNNVYVVYSGVSVESKEGKGKVKDRLKNRQGEIRDSLLRKIKIFNENEKIDLLLWPDADEVFISNFDEYLVHFWESDKKVFSAGFFTVYDSFQVLRQRTIFSHCRAFKYDDKMTAVPYRHRCLYNPFVREDATKWSYTMIHLALLTEENRKMRDMYTHGISDTDDNVWLLPKDIREMRRGELLRIVQHTVPDTTIVKYLKNEELLSKFKYRTSDACV
jgi:hypothetical protein